MLKQALMISTVVALLTVTGSAKGGQGNGYRGGNQATQTTTLTDEQKAGLVFMIEEEKVARDVYLYLHNAYGARIFSNIASSEQKHMDAVAGLINKYGLELPSTLDSQGSFENEELQALYDALVTQGNVSLAEAIEVGILIEETDIKDLQELIDAGLPSDINRIYNNLLKGSYNHLAAFTAVSGR